MVAELRDESISGLLNGVVVDIGMDSFLASIGPGTGAALAGLGTGGANGAAGSSGFLFHMLMLLAALPKLGYENKYLFSLLIVFG